MAVEKAGEKILQYDEEVETIFKKSQECADSVGSDFFIYGHILHELIVDKKYNPKRLIGIILNCKKGNLDTIENVFETEKIHESDRFASYRLKGSEYNLNFYFLPKFFPHHLNDENGFTMDQLYYDYKRDILIDSSEKGLEHLISTPITIKSTRDSTKWDEQTVYDFMLKLGTYDSIIDPYNLEQLRKVNIDKISELGAILWLNRPGTVIRQLVDLFPRKQMMLFDAFLKLLSHWSLPIKENIKPKKVFSSEKLKLIDLYSEYYSSESQSDKDDRELTLIKLLFDI